MNHLIDTIERIEAILRNELSPSIHFRDEKACLMRMQANLAELKFLINNNIGELK